MNRKLLAIAAIPTLILSLAACGSSSGTVTKGEETETVTVEQSAPAEETVEEEVVEEPASTNPTFGDTYTWPNGLAVTISQPEEITPSEYAAGTVEGQTSLAYDVTVTNGTDEDVESVMIHLTVSSGGKEGSAIFDSENGIDFPTSTILPGKSLTWRVAYSVADPTDVQISVSNVIDFSSDKVHFTS